MPRSNHAIAWTVLSNAVLDAWAALEDEPVRLEAENQESTPPDPGEDWARVNIRPAETTNRALGRDCLRGSGVVMIQIFIRKGTGTRVAQVIADALSVLTNTQLPGIPEVSSLVVTMRATGPATFIGSDPAGGWENFMCEIPYHWDSQDDDTFAATVRVTQTGDQRLTQDGKVRILS